MAKNGRSRIVCERLRDMRRNEALEEVIIPVVSGLGFEFVGLQYMPQGKHSLLRLFVDKPGGITIDDCAIVSRQVDAVLSVRAPMRGEYTLEVSSPGLDRLLFTPAQFQEQVGKMVSIRLMAPVEGKRNFKGILEKVEEETIFLQVGDDRIRLSFTDILEARLVPVW